MEAAVGFTCKYCNAHIPALDTASAHECFINKNIYMDNNNVLFVNDNLDVNDESCSNNQQTVIAGSSEQSTKQSKSAVWTDNATMALLSLYEANMHMLDHPKKKAKIWTAISDGLKDFEIEMSNDQIRWKMNILQKKYKECCDNNEKFLENKKIRDTARDERQARSEERKAQSLELKKQIVDLKRKHEEQKRELSNKKLKDKENRHAEIIQIEKTKCELLKKLLNEANVKNISDDSDEY